MIPETPATVLLNHQTAQPEGSANVEPDAFLPPETAEKSLQTAEHRANLLEREQKKNEPSGFGPGKFPGIWHPIRVIFWLIHVAFGTAAIVVVLSIVAAIPALNLLVLGYMLDAQKRVAMSGRLRDGFPLLQLAPRLGVICFFTMLFLIPVQLLSTHANAALIVRAGSESSSQGLILVLRSVQVLTAIHLILAIGRGGSVGCFLRPIKNVRWILAQLVSGEYPRTLDQWAGETLTILRPGYHFILGLKGVFGAILWLSIPSALLVAYSAPGRTSPIFGVLSFFGALVMIPVVAWLPSLQIHQAVSGRFAAIFEVGAARKIIRRAPLAWMFTTTLLYAMTLPLYLAKVRLPPADAFLFLTPIFVLLTYPARLAVAWAWHRGSLRMQWAMFPVRLVSRVVMFGVLAIYVGFLFVTPTISELGKAAPLENHAFLSPIPYGQWSRAAK
ncbi:MAG: hypothetical protein JNL58_11630 [Planctomyces sp.]|nr:hypothetical protein [Planctomyces sp.]